MKEIEQSLREKMGLDAASIGSSLVSRSVRSRMKANGFKAVEDYKVFLKSSGTEWEQLVEAVVITETWFFRDSEPFTALARVFTEQWLPANSEVKARLLSVPCSSGEEPF